MAPMTRAQRREYHAKQRRSQKYRERLQREQARAQRSLEALEQALIDLGLPETGGSRGPGATEDGRETVEQDLWADAPHHVWLPHPPRTEPGTKLGQEQAPEDTECSAQAGVAAAVAAPRAGPPGYPVIPSRGQEDGHPQLLAMDLGRRRQRLQERWPAAGHGRYLVQRPGTSHSTRHQWAVAARRDRRGQAFDPSGFLCASPGPSGAWPVLPRQADLVAGDAGRTYTALQRLGLAPPAPLVVADSWFDDSKLLAHIAHH